MSAPPPASRPAYFCSGANDDPPRHLRRLAAALADLREIVKAGETYAYPEDLTSDQARGLWMEEPPGMTVVFEEHGKILGTAKMGPNRPARGAHIGTASFMVASDARGKGVGRQLGERVVTWHREQGFRGIQFNAVVETNTAAVNLWSDLGFEIIGTVPGAFRSASQGHVGLHIMFLDLAGRASVKA